MTRREALAQMALAGGALALAGCGVGVGAGAGGAARDGSTLHSTFADAAGDGVLGVGPPAPLIDRLELAPRATAGRVLATLAHLTDAHVTDSQSPARVPFLRRLGTPFNSTFRPQEALTAQVLDGAIRAIEALAPDAVLQGGDLIDNAQGNELAWALQILAGRRVRPGSGAAGYAGVQSAGNPDPFYYRPDVDAPAHPGLLARATRSFASRGLSAPWYPVLGDHDLLVQGVLPSTSLTGDIAVGSRAVWDLPSGLKLPGGSAGAGSLAGLSSPDALADPAAIAALISRLRAAPSVAVAPDASRAELDLTTLLARLRRASGRGAGGARLDYSFDIGESVRVIVLDLVRREGGSGGVVHAQQPAWLARELARAGGRWVLVVCHQPLTSSAGGGQILELLDRDRRVLAVMWGHTHTNAIRPRPTAAGGYWLIATCSLIDHPQELRALRVRQTGTGGAVIETWMLDHVPDRELGDISRELAYLDAQGGRPQGFAGTALDRNVRLYKR